VVGGTFLEPWLPGALFGGLILAVVCVVPRLLGPRSPRRKMLVTEHDRRFWSAIRWEHREH
jgi:hypothetical protein